VRPSEKTACRAIFGSAPVRPSGLRLAIPRRGGSARPRKRLRFRPGDRPIRPPGFRLPPNDYVMPRLASGLTTRTHRVRPSEKTTLRVIPEFSPWGNLTLACPPHGGAGSARPLGNALVSPWYAPVRSPASRLLPAPHGMPGLVYGPTTRARRPRPSEKITFRVISGPSPLGDPRCASPRRGGAGSARPQRKALRRPQDHPPFGHRFLANSWVAMTCPGLRPPRFCGRGDRAPPRKSLFASFRGLPR